MVCPEKQVNFDWYINSESYKLRWVRHTPIPACAKKTAILKIWWKSFACSVLWMTWIYEKKIKKEVEDFLIFNFWKCIEIKLQNLVQFQYNSHNACSCESFHVHQFQTHHKKCKNNCAFKNHSQLSHPNRPILFPLFSYHLFSLTHDLHPKIATSNFKFNHLCLKVNRTMQVVLESLFYS